MGLDSVEILMKVENTFGISIPDIEAEKIITVGDFHNSVWKHLEGKHSEKCKSQALFYKLRQSFFDRFNLSKNDIRLDTSPNDIFPKNDRRHIYLGFEAANKIKLPNLVLAGPWSTFLISFGLITILGGFGLVLILINFFGNDKWILSFLIACIVLTCYISKLLDKKRVVINSATIREFTQKVLALNYSTLTEGSGANRKEVESIINHIIADMSGVNLDDVTPEKKICDDLGID